MLNLMGFWKSSKPDKNEKYYYTCKLGKLILFLFEDPTATKENKKPNLKLCIKQDDLTNI